MWKYPMFSCVARKVNKHGLTGSEWDIHSPAQSWPLCSEVLNQLTAHASSSDCLPLFFTIPTNMESPCMAVVVVVC